jgi:hypothetical protein
VFFLRPGDHSEEGLAALIDLLIAGAKRRQRDHDER